ncbi:uncharacterized protein LOC115241176 [Formica exsecta]|uniref:uncharacterized protein LOC115241176 n=1 Tax=Formica exsecta TaxID=72781 RepID=UPI0011436308|nr:uncharacterized protein LOC115241176 [Formica exsecta]
MWIFCALIGLFQLVILLMLSGILFSVAAVSRLMEITIILIYPTTVFLLRQSANLIILLTILTARLTSSAFQKLCALVKCDQYLVDQLERIPQREGISTSPEMPQFLDTQTPFVPYKKTILEEIPEDILPSKDEFSTTSSADEAPLGIIEPPPDQSQDNKTNET